MPEFDDMYDIVNDMMELENDVTKEDKKYIKYSYVNSYDIFNTD